MTPEELKASQENSQDNLTQKDATEKLTKEVKEDASALQNDIVATKTDELSAKVDASMLVSSSKNTDRPTREEFKAETEKLREERREDKKLNRLISGLKKEIAKTSVAKQELNKTTGEYNLLMMNLEDLRNFNDYLMKVRNKTIDPAKEKFQPQNLESFLAMLMQMPYGKWYIEFVGKNGKVAKSGGSNVEYWVVQWGSQSNDNLWSNLPKKIEKNFEKGWLVWMLNGRMDQTNMTPWQKAFRNWTSNLLALWGAVFVWRKMLSSAFKLISDKEERKGTKLAWNLAWLAIPAWLTFAANATSWWNLMDIFKWWKLSERMSSNRFWWGSESNNKKTEFAKTYNEWFSSVWAIFGGLNFWQIKQLVEKTEDWWIKLTQAWKEQLKSTYSLKPDDEKSKLALKNLESTNVDKNVNLWLSALIWGYDELIKKSDDESFDKLYAENIVRFNALDNYLKEKKYSNVDIDTNKKEITEYIRTWKPTLEELDNMWAFLWNTIEIKTDSNREAIKNKVDKLEDGKSLKIKIGDDDAELSKINWISEVELKSKNGNITKINLGVDWPSIIWLWDWASRPFTDKDGNPDFYSTILFAHKLNWFKNRYKNRKVAAGDVPFKYENEKIYFNEVKTWTTEINKVEVMDDGILWIMSEFPDIFKWQEQQIVNYLNKEITLQNQSLEDVIKEFNNKNIEIKLEWEELKSHWETTKIDIANKKIIWLNDADGTWPNRQFRNYSDLVWWANLINFFKSFLRDRQAQSKDPIYIWVNWSIAFNDRTLVEEMKSYANRGANWFWDSDLIQSGELFFRKSDSLKKVSPTLYAHRKEFVQYLNNTQQLFKEYVPEDKEAKKLEEIKKKISEALNFWIEPKIDINASYDKDTKTLKLDWIDEKIIQNDQLIKNLKNVSDQVSWYNIFQSEYVEKIQLPKVDMKPWEFVSLKYLKELMKLDASKFELWANILANKNMLNFVIKEYDEWKFQKETNSNVDMNGVIVLNYIYDNWYDFNRLFNGEDDSRIDFTMRVMELLAWHRTIVDPTRKSVVELDKNIVKTPINLPAWDDPIMKIRRVSKWENVDFWFSKNRQRRKNSDNIDIMNKIIDNIHRYAQQNPPIENVPYIHP